MAVEAVSKALKDASLSHHDIKSATVGYVYGKTLWFFNNVFILLLLKNFFKLLENVCAGDSTCGQRAIYEVGMTGIPIYNVNNNCSTGSTALMLAKQIIEADQADCVLALGFEKMERGSLMSKVCFCFSFLQFIRIFC